MDFRNYKDSDFKELITLLKINNSFDKMTDSRKIFKALVKQNPEAIILAVEGKKLAGYVFAIYTPFESYIHHLGVAPEFRKQGIGSMLLARAEKALKCKGAKRADLFVSSKNCPALGFYKKKKWAWLERVLVMEKEL